MPTSNVPISWVQLGISIVAPLIIFAVAWGSVNSEMKQFNRAIDKIEPVLENVVKIQTIVEQHVQRGAHRDANQRISKLELDSRERDVTYKEILRRLEDINRTMKRNGRSIR